MERAKLLCPVCASDLLFSGRSLRCESNHCFDMAKEGYVNLLLSHQRKSDEAGDAKEMVNARRAFFAGGHYGDLTETLANALPEQGVVLDAGCGTGTFLAAHAKRAPDAVRIGLDISKPAVRVAAKDCGNAYWLVANLMRSLPVRSNSVDSILNVMAPSNASEFARVLKPTGELFVVVPGPGHLRALREALLMKEPSPARDPVARADAALAGRFTRCAKESIRMELHLDAEAIGQLVAMTPLGWKSSHEGLAQVAERSQLTDHASFILLRYHCDGC